MENPYIYNDSNKLRESTVIQNFSDLSTNNNSLELKHEKNNRIPDAMKYPHSYKLYQLIEKKVENNHFKNAQNIK